MNTMIFMIGDLDGDNIITLILSKINKYVNFLGSKSSNFSLGTEYRKYLFSQSGDG